MSNVQRPEISEAAKQGAVLIVANMVNPAVVGETGQRIQEIIDKATADLEAKLAEARKALKVIVGIDVSCWREGDDPSGKIAACGDAAEEALAKISASPEKKSDA